MGLLTPLKLQESDVEDMLQSLLKWILEFDTPSAVILFGSAARGEMTEVSDFDLALIFPDEESCENARRNLRLRPPAVSWAVDFLFYNRSEYDVKKIRGGVCELIALEGRLLFGGPL